MFKKLLSIWLCLILASSPGWGAVTATTVWEIRQDAGDLQNGSCFDSSVAVPGTDYSQQAASQYNGTDLVIDGADNTKVTSAAHNFVEADEGNCVRVSAGTGFTVGWYVITDTSANAATLSSAVGTVGSTGGTYRVGGAALLNSTNADDYFEAMLAGNTAWVRYNASALNMGESVAVSTTDGTTTSLIELIGYGTTRGDTPTGANRPTINSAANGFLLGDYFAIRNLIFTTTATGGLGTATGAVVENVTSTNSSGTAGRVAIGLTGLNPRIINSEFISTNGIAVSSAGSGSAVISGSYLHDSVTCFDMITNDGFMVVNTIFDNCSTNGVLFGSSSDRNIFISNTFRGAATPAGTGINGSAATQAVLTFLFCNIFDGWTTAVNFGTNVQSTFSDYNNFFNNTADRTGIDAGPNDLAVNPGFTDADGGNFAIGTNLKAACPPGLFPGSSTTGYIDGGAAQRQEPAGSSGGSYTFVQ